MAQSIQDSYMSEVLGLTPFRSASAAPPQGAQDALEAIPLVVECEEMTEFTRPLLHKILGSVGIKSWAQIQLNEPVQTAVRHRIRFSGEPERGRVEGKTGVEWNLPSLSQMLGDGPDVTTQKKKAWEILKSFSAEFKAR